jgi:methyl-branched lipid omega-hydroxylase
VEWDDDLRDGVFATLRREAPIAFFEVVEFAGFAPGAGHWALTTFDDAQRDQPRHGGAQPLSRGEAQVVV